MRVTFGAAMVCVCVGVLAHEALSEEAVQHSWNELKGRHFIVRHQNDAPFSRQVLRASEGYYKDILNDLGFRRNGNFWLWENRAKITIYRNRSDFISATGSPAWSAGKANYSKREIATFGRSETFLKSRLPHELAHLIFRDFIGFKGEVPLWLDEGVAQWEEKEKRESKLALARELLAKEAFIPLVNLTAMDVRGVKSGVRARAFYAQAVSVVGYLITVGGKPNFTGFCQQLRDGKKLNDALRFTYPRSTRTIGALQVAWIEWLREGQPGK